MSSSFSWCARRSRSRAAYELATVPDENVEHTRLLVAPCQLGAKLLVRLDLLQELAGALVVLPLHRGVVFRLRDACETLATKNRRTCLAAASSAALRASSSAFTFLLHTHAWTRGGKGQ